MYKTFITGLSFGLLLLIPTTLHASNSASFDEIPSVLSFGESLTSPVINLVSDSTDEAVANLSLFRAYSTLSKMSEKDRKSLAERLELSKQKELEHAIPEEHKDEATKQESCCWLFWRGCFRVSSKTLGSLAIDIILDLSDGKLDGKGPNGSINYIHHIAEIINATIEEIRA
jgi:hypothetical protein